MNAPRHRPRTGRCTTCDGHVEKFRAAFCDACRPYAGAVPYARLVEQAREAADRGDSPRVLADALGVIVPVLERRFYRHGDIDLARWAKDGRNAGTRQGLALWDPAAA